MIENLKNNLVISEEKTIKNTLLYIKNLNVNIESYESKILAEENIEDLIKYQVAYDGDNRILKYDVSGTIGYDELLKSEKLKKEDICKIIIAIDDVLISAENYLLSENSIALDLRLIRVSRKSKNNIKYKFIAIPNFESCFSYELSKFLIRILRHIDVEDKEALSLAYSLFVRSSMDNYTMNDLMEIIDKVYDKNNERKYDISIDDIIKYDEEMANEISEEIMQENKEVIFNEAMENNKTPNVSTLVTSDEDELVIDENTKSILGENILNDFDKDDEKIYKSKENKALIGKKLALKGHISLGFLVYALVPIIVIGAPILYYFLMA